MKRHYSTRLERSSPCKAANPESCEFYDSDDPNGGHYSNLDDMYSYIERRAEKESSGDSSSLSKRVYEISNMSSIAPKEEWDKMLEEGYVKATTYNGVTSWKYTFKTTSENNWNPVTIASRGLITAEDGTILARPYKKFFEWGEVAHKPEMKKDFRGPVVVTDKLDGSLAIGYRDPNTGDYVIGSASQPYGGPDVINKRTGKPFMKHPDVFTNIYNENYSGKWTPDENYTYIYEAITPESKVILDYGDERKLVLTGKVNKKTGVSVPLTEVDEWPGEKAEVFEFNSLDEALNSPDRSNSEGFVVHFTETDDRVKIKQDDYVKYHKAVSYDPSLKNAVDILSVKGDSNILLKSIKDSERRKNMKKYLDEAKNKYEEESQKVDEILNKAKASYSGDLGDGSKEASKAIQSSTVDKQYIGMAFAKAKGNDITHNLWKRVLGK